MDLIEVTITQVFRVKKECAVVLRAPDKTFFIFVGAPEAEAIHRELFGKPSQRPMPHDLFRNVLTGFDIEVRKVVVSSINEGIFCATLMLSQEIGGAEDEVHRNEVRLDLRASDAMIVALKTGSPLFATRGVVDSVEDISGYLESLESGGEEGP